MKKIYLSLFSLTMIVNVALSQSSPISVVITTTDVSTPEAMDGTATGTFSGGVPPYNYRGIEGPSTYTLRNLCQSSYSFIVNDAVGNSIDVRFTIGPTDSTYFYDAPISPTNVYVETIISSVSNCDIDYSSIDSIQISDHTFIENDSVLVTWSIFHGAEKSLQLASYPFSSDGWHTLMIDLSCGLRAGGSATGLGHLSLSKQQTTTDIESLDEIGFSVFPNPSSGNITIQSDQEGDYIVYNQLGQVVQNVLLNASNNYRSSLQILDNGNYFIASKNNAKIAPEKMVIIK